MTAIRLLALLAAAAALSACAQRSGDALSGDLAQSCAGTDWYEQGARDAADGRPARAGLARLAACPQTSEPAQDAYLAGHAEGLVAYCAPANARMLGRQRREPTLDCPAPFDIPFEAAYAQGLSQPAEAAPEDELARAERRGIQPRINPYFSIGLGSGGWRGAGWGLGISF